MENVLKQENYINELNRIRKINFLNKHMKSIDIITDLI